MEMSEHFKIDCNLVDDRRAIAAILAYNEKRNGAVSLPRSISWSIGGATMNDQAKSNPETDTMSLEDMAHYLMDFCHCHLAAGNGCPGCPFDKPTSNDGDGECRLGVPSDWDF